MSPIIYIYLMLMVRVSMLIYIFSNIKIEFKSNNNKTIWAFIGDTLIYREYDDSLNIINDWKILKIPFANVYLNDVPNLIDKNNNKWFVFYDKTSANYILIKYDDLNFYIYTNPFFLHGFSIICLYEDTQGYIWIGTESDGLWRFDANNATTVESTQQTPSSFTLSTAYPNPFNASTTINFTLNKPEKVNLAVYNLTGQRVRELASGNYNAGSHTTVWEGRDDSGNAVSSGVYLARMESGGASKVVRMAMVK